MSANGSKPDHFSDEMFAIGLKNRRKVVGDAYVDTALKNGSTEFAYPNQQLVTEYCWGNIWSRPGLTFQQRSLLNIGMLIGLKSWPELAIHIRGAINNGLTELEIREAILQSSIYCGVPAGIEATKTATRVINEMVANGEHTRELSEVLPHVQ
ncbi:carboxymuconolactone decarboxylase family domain-containing protein [Trichoderma breve]|uniref:Carboxymuconolactone decarboxylase family domain-containing protein n=1 Tax=Trichoderma breve TaxID=2034170 RepID=A0A9W9B7K2_9HYPO|nr:carboxymuconolactone decarboxylase family domain-containing protein [Trichoderma breve]KAJ4858072.1 carboxymuconolactone decarboxylase family domain-containing protein [Trichoderma breve]